MPVGLVIVALAFDALYVTSGYALLTQVSFWTIVLSTAVTATRALRTGDLLEASSGLVLGIAALMRSGTVAHLPTAVAFVVEASGLLLLIVAGLRLERRYTLRNVA
jgi:uncharacterized membrane protein